MLTTGEARWRTEVGRTRAAHPRRLLPFTVNVGWPAGPRVTTGLPWPAASHCDAGLRFDVLDALLEEWEEPHVPDGPAQPAPGGAVCAWLTRPGVPELHDEDLLWHAAARHVAEAREIRLTTFRAVTHTGWLDVATGERRVWRRLRLPPGS